MYRPADGGKPGAAGGDRPVGEKRAGGLYRSMDDKSWMQFRVGYYLFAILFLMFEDGGILQGMSGSPIVQNGKIIGALSHVIATNPKDGIGLYIEWMMEK